jgi:hypothetical protein
MDTVAKAFKMLVLIRDNTPSFSSTDTTVTLYCALVHSKPEFASVAWNSVTLTASSKIERGQRKFANLCYNRHFINFGTYNYVEILATLDLSMLHLRRRHIDALFLINVCVNKVSCPSILHTVGLRVNSKIITDHSIFTALYCAKASPSARFVTAANGVCTKIDTINHHGILLKNLITTNTI